MDELTIKRSDLIDIATEAMKDSGITEEQHIEMCETAHKMEKVLMGGWVSPECGCLVGTAYRNELLSERYIDSDDIIEKFGEPVKQVGIDFDTLLKEKTGVGRLYFGNVIVIVKVIDG